jgi:predicted ATPase
MELIERHDALDALAATLARVRSGAGQVVLIGAEAGGGKSTVVERFLDGLPTDVRVRRGWCDALSTPRPLGPFLDMGSRELQARLVSAANRSEILAVVLDLLAGDAT